MAKKKTPKKKAVGTGDLGLEGAGVAPVKIPEIDELGKVYVRERDRRMELTPKEVKAKKELIAALHEHETEIGRDDKHVLRYELPDGSLIILEPTEEKLKVTRPDSNPEE